MSISAKLDDYLKGVLTAGREFDAEVAATFREIFQDLRSVSEAEWQHLTEKVLEEHRDRFADEALRQDLARALVQQVKSGQAPWDSWDSFLDFLTRVPGLAILLVEACLGQGWQIFKDGKAPADILLKVRQQASQVNFHGTASLVKIDPQTKEVAEIEAALKKAVEAIDGFDFLSRPPEGRADNKHTVLIKVGVNWGHFGYPTVTSPEAVYAVARMCAAAAAGRGAEAEVVVGDESGIEIALWGGTTLENFEHTGILDAAQRAGARVAPFDGLERLTLTIPGTRHFPEGIPVPRFVAEEVTDIINLCKPPGRHMIMGNTGVTGALKNHIGLLAGAARSPGLHGPYDRLPPPAAGQTGDSYREGLKARGEAIRGDPSGAAAYKYSLHVLFHWHNFAPDLPFHEKIAELYLAVRDKERFSITDMRRTVSSIGPDLGDTIDIGAIIAAKDPVTLDILAGALLKRAYDQAAGRDSLLERLVGRTWLQDGTPFDLMSTIAANSYGVGPMDTAHIDLSHSGFSNLEMQEIISCLCLG